ncbi:hypothetical protein [Longispora urticae]
MKPIEYTPDGGYVFAADEDDMNLLLAGLGLLEDDTVAYSPATNARATVLRGALLRFFEAEAA